MKKKKTYERTYSSLQTFELEQHILAGSMTAVGIDVNQVTVENFEDEGTFDVSFD